MNLRDGWRLALGTLTALRVSPPDTVDRDTARTAMLLAPLAALPLGLLVVVVGGAGRLLGLTPLLTGVLVVAAVVAGNRALHVDGLADTVDGLASSYDAERSLAVMRSGTSGPAGVAAVVLVLAVQVVAVGPLLTTGSGTILAGVSVAVSRGALTVCCRRAVPSARPEGLGGTFAGTVPTAAVVAQWVVSALVLAVVAGWGGPPWSQPVWWSGLLGAALAVGVTFLLVRHVQRRLGGVTGDVFGAAVELSWAVLLVGLLVRPGA